MRIVVLLLIVLAPGIARAGNHAVVLLYHHVGDDTPAVTSVTPAQFARHLEYLARHNFHVLPLQDLVERMAHDKPVPERSVAITFDDAYRSVAAHAAPLLAKRSWPYTVFVSSEYIDLGYHNYMSWQQMRRLKKEGASFANHSLSHAHLVRRLPGEKQLAWRQRIRHQIEAAQKRLHKELGVTAKMFAYPYGEFSQSLQAVLEELGYVAFGQQSGAVNPDVSMTALPRFPLMGRYAGPDAFALRVNARPLPVSLTGEKRTLLPASERRPQLAIHLGKGAFKPETVRCFYQGEPMPMHWSSRTEGAFVIRSERELPAGRSKYTCTAPATEADGVYYWYSHLWVLPRQDGSWPPEG